MNDTAYTRVARIVGPAKSSVSLTKNPWEGSLNVKRLRFVSFDVFDFGTLWLYTTSNLSKSSNVVVRKELEEVLTATYSFRTSLIESYSFERSDLSLIGTYKLVVTRNLGLLGTSLRSNRWIIETIKSVQRNDVN